MMIMFTLTIVPHTDSSQVIVCKSHNLFSAVTTQNEGALEESMHVSSDLKWFWRERLTSNKINK